MYTPHFICSSFDGRLGRFYLLAVVNAAAVNVGVQIPVGGPAFDSFGSILRSRVAGSCGSSIFNFFQEQPPYFPQLLQFYIPAVKTHILSFLDSSPANGCKAASHRFSSP